MSSLPEDLLPGIPNDVTLNHIVTKLPSMACQTLSRVSRCWQEAIENRQVYDSRVFHHSTDTLAVVKHQDGNGRAEISLYSMRDKTSYKLPPIPNLEPGILARFSQFISLQGKLYVSGNTETRQLTNDWSFNKLDIYVLDLAGKWQWEQGASISESILDEIPAERYRDSLVMGCAVVLGAEFYVRGGNADCFKSFWHIHDPVKGVYKAVSPSEGCGLDKSPFKLLWEEGKSYSMRPTGIDVWDAQTSSWILRHSEISCDELGPVGRIAINPLVVLPVGNELLAIVQWYDVERFQGMDYVHGHCLLQSRGFGTASKEIVWEKGPDCFHFDETSSLAMCPIQI